MASDKKDVPRGTNHPLTQFLLAYYQEYEKIREDNDHLSNLDFHKAFGLRVDGPLHWPYLDAMQCLSLSRGAKNLVIIYSSSKMFRNLWDTLGGEENNVKYLSFHEMFYVITTSKKNPDQRQLENLRNLLQGAALVLFVGEEAAPSEVVDRIRHYCDNCLILIG